MFKNKNRQKGDFNWTAKGRFFWGEGAAVRTYCTLLDDFRDKENEYHFLNRGCIVTS